MAIPLTTVFLVLMWMIRARESAVAAAALVPALALAVCVGWAAFQPVQQRVLAARRGRFLSDRRPLGDGAFVEAVGVEGADADLVRAARREMAAMCGVPAEAITPGDPMRVLWSMCDEFGAGDTVPELVARVSGAAGVRLAAKGRLEALRTFGELCAELPNAGGKDAGRGAGPLEGSEL